MNDVSRNARLLRAALGISGPVEPTDADWQEWIELARRQRVLPLLHRVAIAPTSGLSPEHVPLATMLQLDVMATMVRFEHEFLEVAEILTDGSFPFAVLKGAATTHLDYRDPSLRQFGDIDLLVSPSDFVRVRAWLSNHGWTQAYPLPRYHERFTHAFTLRNSKRVEIDLHQRIAHRSIGELVSTQSLIDDSVEFKIAGRSLRALCQQDRLIHAAIHSVSSRGLYRRLSSTADVLIIAEASASTANAVIARADSWKVRFLVEKAIQTAYSSARLPVPETWALAFQQPVQDRDRIVERAYLSERRRPALEELAYLRIMTRWRDRSDYVRGYFATDPEYAARRRRYGILDQSRYLWSRLRSG